MPSSFATVESFIDIRSGSDMPHIPRVAKIPDIDSQIVIPAIPDIPPKIPETHPQTHPLQKSLTHPQLQTATHDNVRKTEIGEIFERMNRPQVNAKAAEPAAECDHDSTVSTVVDRESTAVGNMAETGCIAELARAAVIREVTGCTAELAREAVLRFEDRVDAAVTWVMSEQQFECGANDNAVSDKKSNKNNSDSTDCKIPVPGRQQLWKMPNCYGREVHIATFGGCKLLPS